MKIFHVIFPIAWESGPYSRSPLVIATTHQLLKFYQAFDLLIVDEVDAFPYVDNPVLYHAVEQAVKMKELQYSNGYVNWMSLIKSPKRNFRKIICQDAFMETLIIPQKVWLSWSK